MLELKPLLATEKIRLKRLTGLRNCTETVLLHTFAKMYLKNELKE